MSLADGPTADVTPAAAAELPAAGTVTVIDVRDDEWAAGHIRGAIHTPPDSLNPATIDATKPIIAVCRSGSRSAKATKKLRAGGLTARNMTGGTNARAQAGLPVHATDGTPGSIR